MFGKEASSCSAQREPSTWPSTIFSCPHNVQSFKFFKGFLLSSRIFFVTHIGEWEGGSKHSSFTSPLGSTCQSFCLLHLWSHLILLTVTAGGRAWSYGVGRGGAPG